MAGPNDPKYVAEACQKGTCTIRYLPYPDLVRIFC